MKIKSFKKILSPALLILASMIWGFAFTAQKAAEAVPAFTTGVTRSLFATVFLIFAVIAFDKINGTGSRLPAMLNSPVCHHGSPNAQPSGMAPRHSIMGNMAQKNTHNSLPTVSRKNCSIASTMT